MTTKPRLSAFALNLLEECDVLSCRWRTQASWSQCLGGADSTALLLGLDELIRSAKLRVQLIVAHLDHGLRDESRNDAEWVVQFAQELGYETRG